MNDSQIFDQLPGEIDVYPMSSIERFERAFCTNFSCCNNLFPDLHALFDHYDATAHVHHLSPSPGTPTLPPLYSPLSSPPSSPSTHSSTPEASPPHRRPASASLYSVPGPMAVTCPNQNQNPNATMSLNLSLSPSIPASMSLPLCVSASNPSIYHPDAYALSDYPTYEHCYDTAKRYLASTSVPAPSVESASLNSSNTHTNTNNSLSSQAGGGLKGRRGRPPSSSSSGSAHESRKKRRGKTDLAGVPLAATRRRSRKAYPCPIPGCSKSYLNPNGLKYHQEKGTCKIEFPVAVPADHRAKTATATTTKSPGPPPPPSESDDPKQGPAIQSAPAPAPSLVSLMEHEHIHHPQPRQLHHALTQWDLETVQDLELEDS